MMLAVFATGKSKFQNKNLSANLGQCTYVTVLNRSNKVCNNYCQNTFKNFVLIIAIERNLINIIRYAYYI